MKNRKAVATNNGLINPLIAGSNQLIFQVHNTDELQALQFKSERRVLTSKDLLKSGYWEDRNSFHQQIVERKKCSKCLNNLLYAGCANLRNYLVYGVCARCESEILFEFLSDIISRSDFEIVQEFQGRFA